jgi:hypothetical protein
MGDLESFVALRRPIRTRRLAVSLLPGRSVTAGQVSRARRRRCLGKLLNQHIRSAESELRWRMKNDLRPNIERIVRVCQIDSRPARQLSDAPPSGGRPAPLRKSLRP